MGLKDFSVLFPILSHFENPQNVLFYITLSVIRLLEMNTSHDPLKNGYFHAVTLTNYL